MPNYDKFPIVTKTLKGVEIDRHHLRLTAGTAKQEQCVDAKELTDDILMLTTPIVYGFSLADKTWCKLCISSGFGLVLLHRSLAVAILEKPPRATRTGIGRGTVPI